MRTRILSAVVGCALAIGLAGSARAIDSNIQSYVVKNLDDFTATTSVVSVNENELKKISRDAVLIYRLGTVLMRYKEPNKVRIEGSAQGTKVTVVLNGSEQWVSINGLKTHRDFGKSPGKRKSLIDVGLVSEYYLTYTDAKFLREGSVDGVPCAVF